MGSKTKDNISVLILNWLNWEDTIRAIDSVMESRGVKYNLVVIENGSGNDSARKIRGHLQRSTGRNSREISDFNYKFPGQETKGKVEKIGSASLIICEKNYGFSGGCNVGIHYILSKKITGIFLLNSDALIESHTLKEITSMPPQKKDEIVGCRVFDIKDGKEILWSDSWTSVFFGIKEGKKKEPIPRYWAVDRVNGSAMYISGPVLKKRFRDKKFYFDPRYFLYCEETDLCFYATRKLNNKCWVLRDGRAFHHISKSLGGRGNARTAYYLTRNSFLLAKVWLSKPMFSLFCIHRLIWITYLTLGRLIKRGIIRIPVIKAEWLGVKDAFTNRFGEKTFNT